MALRHFADFIFCRLAVLKSLAGLRDPPPVLLREIFSLPHPLIFTSVYTRWFEILLIV
jgi:hypothetical protein